jgi:hypothetical protein
MTQLEAGLIDGADHWHVFATLGPRHDIPPDVVAVRYSLARYTSFAIDIDNSQYFVALIREYTTSSDQLSLAERSARGLQMPGAFGFMSVHYPENLQQMTFAEVAAIEWNFVEQLLRAILQH